MCWSRLLIHATLVFFLIFKDASHLIIFDFQIVFGMRGRFVIALNPRASELARFIMEELIPFWTQMRSYYTSTVHDRLLAQIKKKLATPPHAGPPVDPCSALRPWYGPLLGLHLRSLHSSPRVLVAALFGAGLGLRAGVTLPSPLFRSQQRSSSVD